MSAASNRLALAALLAALTLGAAAPAGATWLEALFAPKAELWERWEAHDPDAEKRIDHGPWQRLLAAYVSQDAAGVNRVAYDRVTPADRQALGDYIAGLTTLPIGAYNRAEQLAYWINLYNALTLRLVLDHPGVGSIHDIDISPGLFGFGPWDKKLIQIEGEALSLNDIEHRILRPIWRDPRVHYAVNCAAIGCPNLARQAFTGANVEAMLTQAAGDYINHPRGAEVRDGRLYASSLYQWYRVDFGDSDAGVIQHLKRFANAELARRLETVSYIYDDDYDWALNAAD